ncbi:MAG: TIGR00725 family protein [Acidobacteriota bacterium]
MQEKFSDLSSLKRVGIIGGNSPDPESKKDGEIMGKLIAENGYILVNGGRSGIMEASAKGAKQAGGFVLSILPGESKDEGNNYTDIAVATGLGYIRNPLVIFNSDILVAIDGSHGTLSEIAYAGIYKKRVLGLRTWDINNVEPFSSPEDIIKTINDHFKPH